MNRFDWATEALMLKGGLVAGASTSGFVYFLTWDASIHLIGVPLNVLLAGLTGALLGLAYGEPIRPRGRLMTVAVVNAFLAAAVTGILPHFPGFGWVGNAPAAAVALVAGIGARWVVPALVVNVPRWIDEWRRERRNEK